MPEDARRPARTRTILSRILIVVGIVLVVVSLLANFVKREALDSSRFRDTSSQLIANGAIRDQVAASMVESLYANVDVAQELATQLPENLQGLAGPLAGLSRQAADRTAQQLLERPRLQALFVEAAARSQSQVVDVLHGNTEHLDTSDGNVVLDLRPLVLALGDRFNFVSGLADRVPQESAQVVLLRSDDLDLAQRLTRFLEAVANWIWIPTLLVWALALWLVPGRRRQAVRAIGVGLIVAGVLVLVVRRVGGSYLVDELSATETARPAAEAFFRILSDGLAESAWVTIVVGALTALAAWLTGHGARAVACRRGLAPYLVRPEVGWAGFVLCLFLLIWLIPFQSFRIVAILSILAAVGFEVLRRQVAAEHPDAGAVDLGALPGQARAMAAGRRSSGAGSVADELDHLAQLRASGMLSDEEFAAAKARLLG